MELLTHPFSLGLGLGLIFTLLAIIRLISVKLELRKFRQHLSERLQVEAEHLHREHSEMDGLKKQNENLRMKIAQLEQAPDRRAARELDILLRAEKRMTLGAPGFAAAWESAKNESLREVEAEGSGASMPRRVMTKLFGGPTGQDALAEGDKSAP